MGRQLLLAVLVGGLLGGALSGGASAGTSPADLAGSMVAAARAEHSFRSVTSAVFSGVHVTQVNDVAARRGIQKITIQSHGQTGHITVLLTHAGAYVRSDSAFIMATYMGFRPEAAQRYVNRWVFVPPSDRDFQTIAAGVDIASALAESTLAAPISALPGSTLGGRRVLAVQGLLHPGPKETDTAVLYLRASGAPLPVREVLTKGPTRGTTDFSRWNEPVHVTAPAGAVPIGRTGLEAPSVPTLA